MLFVILVAIINEWRDHGKVSIILKSPKYGADIAVLVIE